MEDGAMETILYFLFWAGIIFLFMRFGCGAHIMGHGGHGKKERGPNHKTDSPRWVPPSKDIDPVCKKSIQTENAKSSVYAGQVYYFCSRECRERFETAPDLYLTSTESKTYA